MKRNYDSNALSKVKYSKPIEKHIIITILYVMFYINPIYILLMSISKIERLPHQSGFLKWDLIKVFLICLDIVPVVF